MSCPPRTLSRGIRPPRGPARGRVLGRRDRGRDADEHRVGVGDRDSAGVRRADARPARRPDGRRRCRRSGDRPSPTVPTRISEHRSPRRRDRLCEGDGQRAGRHSRGRRRPREHPGSSGRGCLSDRCLARRADEAAISGPDDGDGVPCGGIAFRHRANDSRSRPGRSPLLPFGAHGRPSPLLPDHVHRVREQQAGPPHALRGHRRRRHRALAPDARRRHPVPDRHRRALDQHRPGRGRRGPPDARVRRREGGAVPCRRGRPGDQPRTGSSARPTPTTSAPPRRWSAARTPTATSTSAPTRAGTAPTRASGTRRTSWRRRAGRSARTIPTSRSSG